MPQAVDFVVILIVKIRELIYLMYVHMMKKTNRIVTAGLHVINVENSAA